MTDVHSPKVRSKNMRAIKARNTKPEIEVRKGLHRLGFRYSCNKTNLPGKPDLYFKKYESVILINGCFWHGHNCDLFHWPSSKREFWIKKITDTQERDIRKINELLDLNIKVLLIWECALKRKEQLANAIEISANWLKNQNNIFSVIDKEGLHDVREIVRYLRRSRSKVPDGS